MRLKQNPYHLLLWAGLLLVLMMFFINRNKTVDIHFHDTYYVIAQSHFFFLFAFIVWLLWFLYVLTRKVLYSKSLTWIHVVITLFATLFLIFLLNFSGDIFNPGPRRYLDLSSWELSNGKLNVRWVTVTTVLLMLAQIILVVNLVGGIIKRSK